jgi:hypothetical protein
MKVQPLISRRMLVKSSILGFIAASVPNIVYSRNIESLISENDLPFSPPHDRYPAIKLEIAIVKVMMQNDKVVSLTLTEPGLTLTAGKI